MSFSPDHDLTLIIPAHNEAARLPRSLAQAQQTLDDWRIDYRVVVVDNASRDGTDRVAADFGPRFSTLHEPRPGKGVAVRSAMLAATGRVLAFTDADLPFDLAALRSGYDQISSGTCDVAWGARDVAGSSDAVPRSAWRRLASWGFRGVVRLLLSGPVSDTQCGLKVFSRSAARSIFSRCTIDGFAFDTEVIFLAQRLGQAYRRLPVRLINDEGSTISLRRHAMPMLLDVLRVRWQALQGTYNPAEAAPAVLAFPAFAAAPRSRAA